MTTTRQKKYVRKVLENLGKSKPKSEQQIALESGYSKAMAKNPKMIREGLGVIKLFAQYGISAQRVAGDYNELINLPLKEKNISVDQKRRLLKDISGYIIESPEAKLSPQIQFIDKFLNVQMLRRNRPRIHGGRKEKKD